MYYCRLALTCLSFFFKLRRFCAFQGQADERSFKFFTSVILAFIWPLVVCTYGDELMQQVRRDSQHTPSSSHTTKHLHFIYEHI